MSSISDHVRNIPPVTRFFTIVSLAVSFAFSLEIFRIDTFLLQFWSLKFSSFRDSLKTLGLNIPLIFAIFFVPESLIIRQGATVIFNIYQFYTLSSTLEKGKFRSNFADYLWFVWVCGFFIVMSSVAMGICGLSFGIYTITWHMVLLHCITFVYLRDNMGGITNILGLVPVRCYYLPFFNLAVSCLTGWPSFVQTLQGFLAGYLYQCLQSDTIPFYNLLPGCYGKYNPAAHKENRVGSNGINVTNEFSPAIYDLGYWKAPGFVYKILRYPQTSTVRQTAFTVRGLYNKPQNRERSARSSGYESHSGATFKGRGQRLGN